MTPKQRFYAKIQRRLRAVEPDVARAYLRSLDKLVAGLSDFELERMIASGSIERLLSEVLSDAQIDKAFTELRIAVQKATSEATMFFGRDIPGIEPSAIDTLFGVLSPQVIEAVRAVQSRTFTRLAPDLREGAREIIEAGIRRGDNPKTTARQMREMIGLGPSEIQQVNNYRDGLLGVNGRDWRTYKRRDRRFDKTLERLEAAGKPLTREQVDKMVEAYRRRRIALSAEANARTATLDSFKFADRAAWRAAIENGTVSAAFLGREWLSVLDGRERPEHRALSGTVVGFDERFPNGELIPGESDFNCRCHARTFVRKDALAANKTPAAATEIKPRAPRKPRAPAAPPVVPEAPTVLDPISDKLKAAEDAIRPLRHERAYVLDDKGNVLIDKKGAARSVSFSQQEVAYITDRNAIFTHNHPTGNMPFSGHDIDMAVRINAKQMRAVANGGTTFIMERGAAADWGGTTPVFRAAEVTRGFNDVSKRYNTMLKNADARAYAEQLAERKRLGITGGKIVIDTSHRANLPKFEDVLDKHWQEVAEKYGWIYRKEYAQ